MDKLIKYFLFMLLILNSITVLKAEEDKLLCAGPAAYYYLDRVKHFKNDKLKHCALSCLIARRCGGGETMALGIFKELADVLGYGNAEWEDLRADAKGISLAFTYPFPPCIESCQKTYPER